MKLKYYYENKLISKVQDMQISLNFKTFCCNLKIRGLGSRRCVAFTLFQFERNYDVLKSKKESMLFSEQNETLMKMKRNPIWKIPLSERNF